jgi:hypothetical protein
MSVPIIGGNLEGISVDQTCETGSRVAVAQ